VTIFYNEEFCNHVQDPFHPESPERLTGIVGSLRRLGLWQNVIRSSQAEKERLKLVHADDYIEFIETCGECGLTLDTRVHPETYQIAALSAQCAIDAAVWSGDNGGPSFALTRPPGHHAGRDYGMGFCYFNNISIAARFLLEHGDGKVAIVDFDVHHGNGTEQIFEDDSRVMYISTHQYGIFPGTGSVDFTGRGEGEGFTFNMPFPSGSGDSTYDVAYSDVVVPLLEQFKPDAILVSLGIDSHYRDPLASLSLSSDGHVRQARGLIDFARSRGGRITFMLEGGYDIPALSETVAGIVGYARGVETPLEFTDIMDNSCLGRGVIERCKKNAAEYWSL